MLKELEKEIEAKQDPERAKATAKYFKAAEGGYGEGDIFLGLTAAMVRDIAKKYRNLSLEEIQKLLESKHHEKRTTALTILVDAYRRSQNKGEIVDFYLANTKYINNWDLVDISAYKIVGDYLLNHRNMDYEILRSLSKSENLWERRISILSTMAFVKAGKLDPTFELAKVLLKNEHDLINKAVGWLLREAGKQDEKLLEEFLIDNIGDISSITLSYAMEKFDSGRREKIRALRKSRK